MLAVETRPVEGDAAAAARGSPAPAPSVVSVRGVGKCYHIYGNPSDRLKQALLRWRKTYYREFWAVRGVSFELKKGETLGIIGRNGSGKSTLLQVVAGVLTPTAGSVEVRGRLSALLELGAGFNPEFTGRENARLSGAIYGLSADEVERLLPEMIEFADIGPFIDQPVKTYSSGMFVRLAFAVAAQVRPDVLVIDEALAVGDVFFQQKCLRFMRERLAGAAKVIVTHDMSAISALCDRAIVMHRGEMVFDGEPMRAVEHYTKLVHNEEFRRQHKDATFENAGAGPGADAEAGTAWTPVDATAVAGRGEVLIEAVAVTDASGRRLEVVRPGQPVVCHMVVRAAVAKENLIFGILFVDRMGNNVCGDNSLSLPGGGAAAVGAGRHAVRMEFAWPRLAPGKYTVTFGVGEGLDPLSHVIQCWAHNVAAFDAISPDAPVHGMMTNPMLGMEISAIGSSAEGKA